MNHDYAHCLDHADDCPEECFRGQLVKDLKSSNQCMAVSWMSFEGTDECMKATSNTTIRDTVKIPVMDGTTERLPTADAVEVVRCKDCKKYNTDDCTMIHGKKMNRNVFANDYCSYGVRKD